MKAGDTVQFIGEQTDIYNYLSGRTGVVLQVCDCEGTTHQVINDYALVNFNAECTTDKDAGWLLHIDHLELVTGE